MRKDIEDILAIAADSIVDLIDTLADALTWVGIQLTTPASLLRLVLVGIVALVLLY